MLQTAIFFLRGLLSASRISDRFIVRLCRRFGVDQCLCIDLQQERTVLTAKEIHVCRQCCIKAKTDTVAQRHLQHTLCNAAHARRPAGFDQSRTHQRCDPIIKLAQGIAVRQSRRVQLRLQKINRIAGLFEFR